jgi:hypothetical protein
VREPRISVVPDSGRWTRASERPWTKDAGQLQEEQPGFPWFFKNYTISQMWTWNGSYVNIHTVASRTEKLARGAWISIFCRTAHDKFVSGSDYCICREWCLLSGVSLNFLFTDQWKIQGDFENLPLCLSSNIDVYIPFKMDFANFCENLGDLHMLNFIHLAM